MRRRSTLLTQVLAVNALLVGVTALIAAMVARDRLADAASGDGLLVLGLTVASAILLNSLLLRMRLRADRAARRGDDARRPRAPGHARRRRRRRSSREVQELTDAFNRMLDRLEEERREAGRAVLRAQEQERSRIAQDLHDEVNQALTAILLRLSATIGDAPWGLRSELQETQELVSQAMDELLALARQLRPTALDDHGLIAALAGQVSDFGQRTGMQARFHHHGEVPTLSDEEQLVIFRVTQESLSNIAKHAGARDVDVELSFVGRTRAARARRRRRLRGASSQRSERPHPRPARRPRPERHARARAARRRELERLHSPRRGDHHRADHGSDMRILIADDHGIVRGGLKLLIERQPDMEVVAEAEDGVDAFEQALQTKPDLCVMDVSMPRMTGLQAARQIRAHLPSTQVLALSMHDDERYVFDALKAGASGYVLKREVDSGAAQRDPRRAPRRRVPDQRGRALADPRLDVRRRRGPGGAALPARAGGAQADRRGAHEQADRRDPAPGREDGRVAPREPAAQARACATASSSCATRSGAG